MGQSNADILKGALAAFAQGDVPAVLAACHEDIACRIPGANLVSGEYTGHDGLLAFFTKLGQLSAGTIKVGVSEIFDNGSGMVLALCKITAERDGRHAALDAVQVWHFADGKAASLQYFYGDQAAVDAFWS